MNPEILETILAIQRLAYVLIGDNLRVLEVVGLAHIGIRLFPLTPGRTLIECLPELMGAEDAIEAVLAGTQPQLLIEHINRTGADGALCYITLCLRPYHDPRSAARLILVLTNTTQSGTALQALTQHRNELRLLSAQLAQQNAALEQANLDLQRLDEMRSNFVAVAAHELRNPLTPILGYLELLLEGECGMLNPTQHETLQAVLKNVLRLRTITTDLLDLARIESGRIDLNLQPLDLRYLLEMVCHEYQPQLAAKQQTLQLTTAPDLPQVLGDETRAAQILGNLISNASKYTPESGTISLHAAAKHTGYVQVAVNDTGIGIAVEDQPHLFNAFFRARSAAANGSAGTGLGLHITRLLVGLHGGQIWFTSTPSQGSTFFVTFPTIDRSA